MKVAFVTPRYGPQVMGGAETAARQLAEHLLAETGWEAEAYSTCALDPHTWADELEPGTSEINGVPVHRFASAHGRLPEFYGLDGRLRLAPQRASRDEGRRWVDYNGPVSPDLIDAVIAADADVIAFYPYLYHPTVAAIGKVKVPAVLHPAAHDEPALYLPVFRGTFGDADAFCFHTAAERLLVERTYPVAEKPQIVLGLGVGESAGAGRPGGDLLGLGDRPYIVSVGRVDEHKGSKMLAAYFADLQGAASRTVGPGTGRADFGGARPSPRHRDHRDRRRGRQVGHRARRAGGGVAFGARVVLPGRAGGLGGPGAGRGQRGLRSDP